MNNILLSIIQTWNISQKPEYRGFRCANCQTYKNEAWHHWVDEGGFKLPIHLCGECEDLFQNNSLIVDESKQKKIDRNNFKNSYSPEAVARFQEIVDSWDPQKAPELKAFTCDSCSKDLNIDSDGQRKGFHVWWKMPDETLAELHFHKECADSFG